MAIEITQSSILNVSSKDFAASILPLYTGPQVTVCIGSAEHKYNFPKALLCKQSKYFAATFDGGFKEGEEQLTTLEEIDGVVSDRSFQILAQWICQGRIVFGDAPPREGITTAIEFARLADMCGVTGIESLVAEHIKEILRADLPAHRGSGSYSPQRNTEFLTSENIISASYLPVEHPVRGILAKATVGGYFASKKHKFVKESQELPGFAADLLGAIRDTLSTVRSLDSKGSVRYQDPITDQKLNFIIGN